MFTSVSSKGRPLTIYIYQLHPPFTFPFTTTHKAKPSQSAPLNSPSLSHRILKNFHLTYGVNLGPEGPKNPNPSNPTLSTISTPNGAEQIHRNVNFALAVLLPVHVKVFWILAYGICPVSPSSYSSCRSPTLISTRQVRPVVALPPVMVAL